jgi:nickel-dependent lactate racemase
MIYYQIGTPEMELSSADLRQGVHKALDKIGMEKKVLALPPDFTRFHSMAGEITRYVWEYYGKCLTDILPALGTHFAMTDEELTKMFGDVPKDLFRIHNWRSDIQTLGEVPAEFLHKVSGGKVNYAWPAQVNKLLSNGGHDLILSIGQVVPHEVIGMANHNKNIFVGTGGAEGINKSHFLGAAYGMEKIMGRADTPVRSVLDYASENFGKEMPIVYILTVVGRGSDGKRKTRGLYIGDDKECFYKAAELSLKVNFELLDAPLKKVVVYLDPEEFKSTWLGNKSIYRSRMAIADEGELIVLAPGLREFGEDKEIDRLIRKYGYVDTPQVLELTKANEDLNNNLSAAAHLIHGSTEGRFSVTYCPGKLSEEEIRKANYNYAPLDQMLKKYDPAKLKDGMNILPGGEEVFFISNPALGLWAYKGRFGE